MTSFRDLHKPGAPFVLANAWDRGSAQVLAALGAQALATSSAAHAFTLGRPDMGTISRDEALAHAQDLASATGLPVNGDFENGFGDSPDDVAQTVRLSGEIGLAGCGIEDTVFPSNDAYPFDLAVERIAAGAAAARALSGDFVLTARADGVMNGTYDMAEALKRVRAFDEAGADCIYVPLPPDLDGLRAICSATTKPVNVLAAGPFTKIAQSDLAQAGAARISFGGALARATHKAMIEAARKAISGGDFSALGGVSGDDVDALLAAGKQG